MCWHISRFGRLPSFRTLACLDSVSLCQCWGETSTSLPVTAKWAKIHCWGGSLSQLHTVTTICCRLEQEAKLGLQRLDRGDANHIYRPTGGEWWKRTNKGRDKSEWNGVELNVMPSHEVTWKYLCLSCFFNNSQIKEMVIWQVQFKK